MKKFFSFIGREIARGVIIGASLILFIAWAVYALSYPSTPPSGEIAGGKFMQYFNSIKVACPAGQYLNGYDVNFNKLCATAPTGSQGPAGVNGATGPQGPAGTNGAQGPQWPTGSQGPQWPTGANGGAGGFYNDGGPFGCGLGTCAINPKTGWYSCPAGYTGYRAYGPSGWVVSGLVLCL